MKMHPFLKSLFVIIVCSIILFLNIDNFFSEGIYINAEGEPYFTETLTLFYYLGIPLIISFSYCSPFFFFDRIKSLSFWKLIISIFIFLITIIYLSEPHDSLTTEILRKLNEKYFLFPEFNFSFILIFFICPLGSFYVTNFLITTNRKLLFLLLLAFPIGFYFGLFLNEISGSILVSLISNLVSNLYITKFSNEEFSLVDEDILDSPNL